MCTNGVNTTQFNSNIEQIDEAIALVRRWTHRSYHAAEDAGYAKTAEQLKEAQGLLDEARALLSNATDTLEREAADSPSVSVTAV